MKERKLNRAKKNNEQYEAIIENITKHKNKTEVKKRNPNKEIAELFSSFPKIRK